MITSKLPEWLATFIDDFPKLSVKLKKLFVFDLGVGILNFFSESAFIFILHSFLFSLNLLPENKDIPAWLPRDVQTTALILVFYGVLRSLILVSKKAVPTLASHLLVRDLRTAIFRRLLFSNKMPDPNAVSTDFSENSFKAGQYLLYMYATFENLLLLIFITALSLRIAFYETLLSYLALICLLAPFTKYLGKAKKLGEYQSTDYALVNKSLHENLRNLFLIKVYKTEERELEQAKMLLHQHESRHSAHVISIGLVSSFPSFAGIIVVASISVISSRYLSTPPLNLVGFLYLFIRSAQTASNLKASISGAIFHSSSFRAMSPLLDSRSQSVQVEPMCFQGPLEILVKEVCFSYGAGVPVLRDLSLRVDDNKFVLIKGSSGSGKSTFLQLLLGLDSPTKGEIYLAGLRPSEFIEKFNSSIGYVGPEPFLIGGTLRDNLEYGSFKRFEDSELWESVSNVGLKAEFMGRAGLETILDYPLPLSTGQKQRIGLARALLRKPKLLVLDEATANIDHQTEELILDVLRTLKNKTNIIAISHRNSFDALADTIMHFRGQGIVDVTQ